MLFRCQLFFENQPFEKLFKNYHQTVLNGFDPDPAGQFVRHDLGQICLQRLLADNISSLRYLSLYKTEYSKTCLKWPLKKKTKSWFSMPIIT